MAAQSSLSVSNIPASPFISEHLGMHHRMDSFSLPRDDAPIGSMDDAFDLITGSIELEYHSVLTAWGLSITNSSQYARCRNLVRLSNFSTWVCILQGTSCAAGAPLRMKMSSTRSGNLLKRRRVSPS